MTRIFLLCALFGQMNFCAQQHHRNSLQLSPVTAQRNLSDIILTRVKSRNHHAEPLSQTHPSEKLNPLLKNLKEEKLQAYFGQEYELRKQQDNHFSWENWQTKNIIQWDALKKLAESLLKEYSELTQEDLYYLIEDLHITIVTEYFTLSENQIKITIEHQNKRKKSDSTAHEEKKKPTKGSLSSDDSPPSI